MRPIVSEQSPLRYPLNELLGTEAHVRLLRILAKEVESPLSASEAAQKAGLTARGAQKALTRLARSGFLYRTGGGRRHLFELRRTDTLVQAIAALFGAEADRYELLIDAIKNKIESVEPPPLSAWIDKTPEKCGDSLVLGILHESRHVSTYCAQFRSKVRGIERDFDITIEIEGYTKADLPVRDTGVVVHLYGFSPFTDNSIGELLARSRTHGEKDRRLLHSARMVAAYLEKDASLLRRAKVHVHRLLEKKQGPALKDIEEWRDILESYSIRRLSRFLVSPSEGANRLRQSCPFFAVLTTDERNRIVTELGKSAGRGHDARTT